MLPSSVSQLTQTYVTIQRLEAFLDEPEVEDWVSGLRSNDEPSARSDGGKFGRAAIIDGTFRYQDVTTAGVSAGKAVSETRQDRPADERTPLLNGNGPNANSGYTTEAAQPEFELRNVNIEFPIGQLTLVVGPTGSGKTSLFMALLGEMDRVAGQVVLHKGSPGVSIDEASGMYDGVAYSSQLPWLQHASIKNVSMGYGHPEALQTYSSEFGLQNILFGSPFEEQRYKDVVEACALEPDLALFDAGDETGPSSLCELSRTQS